LSQILTILALCQLLAYLDMPTILTVYSSVDESILQHMIDTQAEFLMEVTDKTKADIKVRRILCPGCTL